MSAEKLILSGDFTHLRSFAKATPKPSFHGSWVTLELQPDVFTPQKFTVGVVVQSHGDRLHFKLLDDFKKFDCIYQEQFPLESIRDVMSIAEEALRNAVKQKTPITDIFFGSSCLSLSPPLFTSGDSQETTVERLFSEVVVLAFQTKKKGRDFESIDTLHARQLVNEELKRIAQMDYEYIINPNPNGVFLENHFLDLNLLTARACGSVTSAVYQSSQSIELNLLKASRDLTTYSRVKNVSDIGLFLLMPDKSQIDNKAYNKINQVIEEHEWKLVQDGFRVVSLASPADLASEIYSWAKPTIN